MINSQKRVQCYTILFPTITRPTPLFRVRYSQHCLISLLLIDIWIVFQFSLILTHFVAVLTTAGITVKLSLEELYNFGKVIWQKSSVKVCAQTLWYSTFNTEWELQTYSWNKWLKLINLRDDIDLDIAVFGVCLIHFLSL